MHSENQQKPKNTVRSGRSPEKPENRLTPTGRNHLIQIVESYTRNNLAVIRLNGKVPVDHDWQKAKPWIKEHQVKSYVAHWLDQPDYPNFGVVIPEHILVVDVDPRNFKHGVDSLDALSTTINQNLLEKANYKVITGSGGYHLYFSISPTTIAQKPRFALKLKAYPGIEFKTKGGQVVIPGSIHPETDKIYEETIDSLGIANINEAPQGLLNLLTRTNAQQQTTLSQEQSKRSGQTTVQDTERCRSALAKLPASVQGENGDNQLYQAACLGKDFNLSPAALFPLLQEYNQRSIPPWSNEELKQKINRAYNYAKNPAGSKAIDDDFDALPDEEGNKKSPPNGETQAKWIGKLDRTKAGEVKNTYGNAILLLENMDIFAKSLAVNVFNDKIVYRRTLIWHPEYALGVKSFPINGRNVDDDELLYIKRYFVEHNQIDFSKNTLVEAVRSVALFNQFHPVREMLKELKWDGQKRIDSWLSTYLGAENTPYTQAVGKKFLLAAVTRIFEPGTKFDTMMVLEGKDQGKGKSTTLDILSRGWFIDNISDFHSKDTLLACHNGVWIAECAELDFMSKVEITAQKSFASRRIDSFRAPYDRFVKDYPRQFVMVGTTNQFQYLRDETGNRRYLPIRTHEIDLNGIRKDVEQLWAETYALYLEKSYSIFMDNDELRVLAEAQQNDRLQVDSWESTIEAWLENEPEAGNDKEIAIWKKKSYQFEDLWQWALQRNPGHFPKPEQNRIAAIMRKLGYEYKQMRIGEKRIRGFVKC